MAERMSAQEKRWRAESDADTMARYQEIMGDSKRKSAAIAAAKRQADALTKRANAMKAAAGPSKRK